MNEIIRVEDVSKIYIKKSDKIFGKSKKLMALNKVSLSIQKGEIFGLVGESGSGKTTLAKIIMGIIKPDLGKISYKGKDINSLSKQEKFDYTKKIQMVFQNPYSSFNPNKTIGWTMTEIMSIHGPGTKSEWLKRASELLEEVDLEASILNQYPRELSGGQRQRVSIASALMTNPELIVIDEGVSALDVSVQAQVLNLILDLRKKYDFTSIFISHDLNVIDYICDRIAVLYNGELQDLFDAEDVYKNERADYTKLLFNSVKGKI